MPENNMQQSQDDANMSASGANEGNAAGAGAPEDAASAYQATINQQGDTIDAILQANERLQKQIQQMLRNGASIRDDAATDNQSAQTDTDSGINPPGQLTSEQIMNSPDYEPLSALGKNIGKKPARE